MSSARPDLLTVSSRAVGDYLEDLRGALDRLNVEALGEVLAELVGALDAGCRVFVAGNGGSATTASHFVADLSAAMALRGSESALVSGLADNVARVTAIANDMSYEQVFAHQLACSARPGDVVLLISVSGESPNLIRAAETARELGMTVLSLVGQPSRLASLSDRAVVVGERDYGLCEDLHLAANHVAVRILRGVRRFECSPSQTTESLPND